MKFFEDTKITKNVFFCSDISFLTYQIFNDNNVIVVVIMIANYESV